jgi:hypothetical protein
MDSEYLWFHEKKEDFYKYPIQYIDLKKQNILTKIIFDNNIITNLAELADILPILKNTKGYYTNIKPNNKLSKMEIDNKFYDISGDKIIPDIKKYGVNYVERFGNIHYDILSEQHYINEIKCINIYFIHDNNINFKYIELNEINNKIRLLLYDVYNKALLEIDQKLKKKFDDLTLINIKRLLTDEETTLKDNIFKNILIKFNELLKSFLLTNKIISDQYTDIKCLSSFFIGTNDSNRLYMYEFDYYGSTYDDNIKNFIKEINNIKDGYNKIFETDKIQIVNNDDKIIIKISQDIDLAYYFYYIESTPDRGFNIPQYLYKENKAYNFIKFMFTNSHLVWKCKIEFIDDTTIDKTIVVVDFNKFNEYNIPFKCYFILTLLKFYFKKPISNIEYEFVKQNYLENHNIKTERNDLENLNDFESTLLEIISSQNNIISLFKTLKTGFEKYEDHIILNSLQINLLNNNELTEYCINEILKIKNNNTMFFVFVFNKNKTTYRINVNEIIKDNNIINIFNNKILIQLITDKYFTKDLSVIDKYFTKELSVIDNLRILFINIKNVNNFFGVHKNFGNIRNIPTLSKGGNKYTLKELKQLAIKNKIKITKMVVISNDELHKKLKDKNITINKKIKLEDFKRILMENNIKITKRVNLTKQELIKKIISK